ncbi:MAG: dihydrolipoyl dehydrogenase [Dehalococcoidia bacterium]
MPGPYDVAILGGGPGGYVAAIRAAQLGMTVAVVEREALGGVCLNWGCIPTKALLRTSEVYSLAQQLESFGLKGPGTGFDIAAITKRSRDVAAQMSNGVKFLMRKNKVDVIEGAGTISGPGAVSVERGNVTTEVKAKHIIIATGARPRAIPGIEPDGKLVWSYREAMVPQSMPSSLLVIGSGAIGMEFASFYRALGAEVTVVEVLPRILPVEDEEISTFARRQFEKLGIQFHTSARVTGLQRDKTSVTATIESEDGAKSEVKADRAIVAVGVQGNVEGIGLEALGVNVERGFVTVDEWQLTSAKGVYAIGDVAGPPCLAHKAMHEGVICVERIAGVATARPLERNRIPGCTYCHPQVASVGLTEAAAREAGYDVKVGKFPFLGNGKAVALGEPQGMTKTVFDAKTGELLGAHMAGAEVTELIQGFVIAMTHEATEESLAEVIFPHPTISETMHESVLAAFGRALHI